MNDLPQEKKDKILLEERYRIEVRKSLEQKQSKGQRIIDFFNSPFAIWLLSSVILAALTSLWVRVNQRLSKSETDAKTTREITAKFQDAAHSAIHSFSQHMVKLNDSAIEAKLTEKIAVDRAWESSDLDGVVPHYELNNRLYALTVVDAYMDVLAAAATPKDPDFLKRTFGSFQYSVERLNEEYMTFPSATPGAELQKSRIASFCALVKALDSGNSDPKILRSMIAKCQLPLENLLTTLESNLAFMEALPEFRRGDLANAETKLYNKVRAKTGSEDYNLLIQRIIVEHHRLLPQANLDYEALLSDLETVEKDLLNFEKTDFDSKKLPTLSAEIDEFAARAKVFENDTPPFPR